MNVRMVSRLGNRAMLTSLWSPGPLDTAGMPFALISGEMVMIPDTTAPEPAWPTLWAAARRRSRANSFAHS